jgi:hypothetical protein
VLAWLVIGVVTYFYFRARSPEKLTSLGSFLAEDISAEEPAPLDA